MSIDTALLAELLEDSTDALALIDPESLKYIYFSEGVVRMLGVDRETLERVGPVGAQASAYGAADVDACAGGTPKRSPPSRMRSSATKKCCTWAAVSSRPSVRRARSSGKAGG